MKNFITKFKAAQSELLGLIAKKQLNIVSVNGIPSGQPEGPGSATHEQGLGIFKEYNEYTKESRGFEQDSTKIVVSKKLFLNLLSKLKEYNLFMFTKVDEGSKVQLYIEKEKWKIIDYVFRQKLPNVLFVLGGVVLVLLSIWILFSSVGDSNLFAKYVIVVILLFVGAVVVNLSVSEIVSIRKAKSKIDTVTRNDFLKFGYDHDVDYYSPSSPMWLDETTTTKVSVSFANMPNYSEMIADSIPMQGSIGYIVRKNDEAQFSLHNMTLRMMGPVIPVIILKHSIIFDTAYLQNINGNVFLKGPGGAGYGSLIEEGLLPIRLEPKMFL